MVPQLVICHKCSAILYESVELKPPEEIILNYDGKCPNCGKKLSYIPKDFEVKPFDEPNQLGPLKPEKRRQEKAERAKKQAKKERKSKLQAPTKRKKK